MSSHHIIRDEQEPPVVVLEMNDNWKELSEILGWSPILLVKPSLSEVFELKQIKIDGFVIEGDISINENEKGFAYQKRDLGGALLQWIDAKKCTALNIFCDAPVVKELFQQMTNRPFKVPIIFFTEQGKFILKPGGKFRKWYPKDFRLNILNEQIKNFKNLVLENEGYRVQKEGFVTISVDGELVLLNEK